MAKQDFDININVKGSAKRSLNDIAKSADKVKKRIGAISFDAMINNIKHFSQQLTNITKGALDFEQNMIGVQTRLNDFSKKTEGNVKRLVKLLATEHGTKFADAFKIVENASIGARGNFAKIKNDAMSLNKLFAVTRGKVEIDKLSNFVKAIGNENLVYGLIRSIDATKLTALSRSIGSTVNEGINRGFNMEQILATIVGFTDMGVQSPGMEAKKFFAGNKLATLDRPLNELVDGLKENTKGLDKAFNKFDNSMQSQIDATNNSSELLRNAFTNLIGPWATKWVVVIGKFLEDNGVALVAGYMAMSKLPKILNNLITSIGRLVSSIKRATLMNIITGTGTGLGFLHRVYKMIPKGTREGALAFFGINRSAIAGVQNNKKTVYAKQVIRITNILSKFTRVLGFLTLLDVILGTLIKTMGNFDGVERPFKAMWNFFKDIGLKVYGFFAGLFSGIWEGIKDLFGWLGDALNWLLSLIGSAKIDFGKFSENFEVASFTGGVISEAFAGDGQGGKQGAGKGQGTDVTNNKDAEATNTTANNIATGGRTPTIINLNIGELIGLKGTNNFGVNKGMKEVADMVSEAVVRGANSAVDILGKSMA